MWGTEAETGVWINSITLKVLAPARGACGGTGITRGVTGSIGAAVTDPCSGLWGSDAFLGEYEIRSRKKFC